jgi:hypothetical protein
MSLTYPIAEDLGAALLARVDAGYSTTQIVVVEEHPDYRGQLVFQLADDVQLQQFYLRYQDWLSHYCVLRQLHSLPGFLARLDDDGFAVLFAPTARQIVHDVERWNAPLHIEGYDLYPFQQFGLNRAFEQQFWFFNWDTGSGKSYCCAAGAKELFNRDQIDLVIAATIDKGKINLCRWFSEAGLDAVVNDGEKAKRRRGYAAAHQVYVLNYEKLRVDEAEIGELITGQRVCWIFNEAYKIGTADRQNKARQAFERLIKRCAPRSKIWPMSATAVNGNPLRYRDIFSIGMGDYNPLGVKVDFEHRYARRIQRVEKKVPGRPYTIPLTFYDWDLTKLTEVAHRVGNHTQVVRKSDPGVREYFKGLTPVVERIQMAPEARQIVQEVITLAKAAQDRGEGLGPYYALLRYLCNTPAALTATENPVALQILGRYDFDKIPNAKLERLNEHLEAIRDQGDKVLVFTQWTNLTLHLIAPHIRVPHVVHYGVGQSARQSQEAQDRFRTDPDITCFLTSDAGSHELNMQCARYVIQYEPTYSYDTAKQRAARIDRSDSHLDGLTNFQYVTDDSVEERVMAIQTTRRLISEAVQGSVEALSAAETTRASVNEADNYDWLLFGE